MRSGAARELGVGMAALAAILVLTALVAINLLQRMTPAFGRALVDNVESLNAAGQMLDGLAAARLPEPAGSTARRRFFDALALAEQNTTEPGELELVQQLRTAAPAALEGDPRALERALELLDQLRDFNRVALRKAEQDVRRLGTGGAWTIALLGMFGFGAGLFVRQRLQRRIVAPLHELTRVLSSVERGDELQRCATQGHFGQQQALRSLNRLLDSAQAERAEGPVQRALPSGLVPWLLDGWGGALAVVGRKGELLSASQATLDLLSGESGQQLREGMQRVARGLEDEQVAVLRRSDEWTLVSLSKRAAGSSRSLGPSATG